MEKSIEHLLEAVMRKTAGTGTTRTGISRCTRLSGGASMESWSFDRDGAGFVLRRAADTRLMAGRPIDHATEAAVVRKARDCGVSAPQVVAVLQPADDLGSGYIMQRVEGEVSPAAILRDPDETLIDAIAQELAAIHAAPVTRSDGLPAPTNLQLLDAMDAQFAAFGGNRPIIALALKWCRDNPPAPAPPRLVHGDFRLGNLMVADGRVAAVLDWELAHLGDPHEDLAWGCVGPWRFANYGLPAFGLTGLDRYFAAYEKAGGVAVNRASFRYWLIHRTAWWALGCLQMADIWRQGLDRGLERAAIARRTVENEIDLLLLLEQDAAHDRLAKAAFPPPVRPVPPRIGNGETSDGELLEAVGEWIARDVRPRAQGRERFLAAVAMNALKVAARSIADPVEMDDRKLCDAILAGASDLAAPGILASLREKCLRKALNDCPNYPGLAAAIEKWT